MENLNKKQKKKRTRRCLDELRQKTRPTNGKRNIGGSGPKQKACYVKNSTCITSNRLTLSKCVRSETVTRLLLSKTENKTVILNTDHTKKKTKVNSQSNIVPLQTQKDSTVLDQIIAVDTSETENISPELNIYKIKDETPKSIMLFSPESEYEELDIKLNSTLEECNLSWSSWSPISSPNFESDGSNEFIDNIENRIEKSFHTQLIICDMLMEKKKSSLRKICMQSICKDSTPNILRENDITNIQDTPMITQNPRDYLEHAWEPHSQSHLNEICISSATDSPAANSIDIPSSSAIASTQFESPEYFYYPHRLN